MVPVALMFVKLPVPEFRVPIFPVLAVRELIIAVAKAKMFPVTFVTVVEAKVEEEDTNKF